MKRAEKKLDNKSKKTKIIEVILFIAILGLIGVIIYQLYTTNKSEAKEVLTQIEYYDMALEEGGKRIDELVIDYDVLADYLYDNCKWYYESSKDDAFKRLYEERIPDEKEYEENRAQTFIYIYALLENYPDMKSNGKISHVLGQIEDNRVSLTKAVENYGLVLDHYNTLVQEYNDTLYCNVFTNKRLSTNKYKEIVLQK